ncbi:MAG: AI-2E family transporter [Micromonosporaceae bacterium]
MTGGERVGRFEQVRDNLRRAYEAGRASVRAAREEARAAEDDGLSVSSPAPPSSAPPNPAPPNSAPPTAAASAANPAPPTAAPAANPAPLSPAVPAPAPAAATPAIVLASTSASHRDDLHVPRGLRIAGAWAWRVLLLVAAVAGVLWVIAQLQLVVVPLVIALLFSALLSPVVGWLRRRHVPRSLATALVVIGGIAAVVGVLTLVVNEFIAGSTQLSENAAAGLNQIQDSLHLTDKQVDGLITSVEDWLRNNRGKLTSGALTTAATLGHVLAGIFLVLFATFFFLRDGRYITGFLVGLLPEPIRDSIGSAADVSWRTLVAYVRATVLVAFIDAVGIGLWLVILRVPFWLPLAALVFLGAFVPIIGATLSGAVAVLVALVTRNPFVALLVLAGVIAVQQLEGHVLQPLIMGRAVAIHPLAVIVAIAAGIVLAGIIGALVAVPIVAVLNTGIRHLAELRRAEETGGPPPGPPLPTGPPQPGAAIASFGPLPPDFDR